MIQSLSTQFQKKIASLLFLIFYVGFIYPIYATANGYQLQTTPRIFSLKYAKDTVQASNINIDSNTPAIPPTNYNNQGSPTIGGPTQPEMSSFKSIGADDMVNLFTGDFSYNIPLMDVGGYPINIFYDGSISMEQEASWVGLGWNINPGTISRNTRGIPDDFNGTEKLIQTQTMKPNKTWGVKVGADAELFGLEFLNGGLSLGASFNNYLGPALEIGLSATISTPSNEITKKMVSQKKAHFH